MKKELQKLIKALEVTKVPQKVPDGWYTLAEIAKSKNKSIANTSKMMRIAIKNGTVEVKKFTIQLGKVIRPCPHYKAK